MKRIGPSSVSRTTQVVARKDYTAGQAHTRWERDQPIIGVNMTLQPKGLCHNGKEFESCLMYRIGKRCDPRYQKDMTEEEIAAVKKAMGVKE